MQLAGATYLPDGDTYFRPHFEKCAIWEEDGLRAGLEYVTEWDCAVDGGAHVGSWTRELAKHFGKVWAFEPQTANFECLLANTAGLDNVSPQRMALGDRYGRVQLAGGANSGCWHVVPGDGVCWMMRLDDLRPLRQRRLGYIKLDIEGCEYEALVGAQETLERCRPVVQIEEKGLPHRAYDGTARSFLESLGYKEARKVNRDAIFVHADH